MIEVGEYVRTIDGYIFKVKKIERDENIYMISYHDDMNNYYTAENYEKINHSKNISDIVELYDYVNGFIVFDIITRDNGEKAIQLMHGVLLEQDEIDSIVTHEQFEAMKYKVEE